MDIRRSAISSVSATTGRSAHPQGEPIPGDVYLGVPCAHCDEMVLIAFGLFSAEEDLNADLIDLEDRLQKTCVRGHLTRFHLEDLRWFQWRPRLNS